MKDKTTRSQVSQSFASSGRVSFRNISLHRGFTMLEALVSITILTLVFVAPLGLAFKMNSQFDYIQKKVVANNLAQEGIEMVQAFRADAALSCIKNGECDAGNMDKFWVPVSTGFVQRMKDRCIDSCAIDMIGLHNVVNAAGNVDYDQFIAATSCTGMYAHDAGPYTCATVAGMVGEVKSGYSRYIKVEQYNNTAVIDKNTELLVTSGISFYTQGELKKVEVKAILKAIN